ncbi:AraC family transcriptional regulator [Microbacterium sp. MYb62]|uniref:helix-turn-helix domain-containing protein n=1 Tax=Microbacterium sp. MYb62 TaxID=1848690 RepID=UPI0011B030BD|nr:AraC family transcriptional regulator [Microbacterium sp. MYb62]
MTAQGSWSHYASPRHALRRLLVSCHGAGEQSGPLRPFSRRALPTRGLVYVSEGRGTYEEYEPRSLRLPVEGPAVIWLTPGVRHGYGPDAGGWSEHWILFEGEPFAAFEGTGLGGRLRPVQSLARPVDEAEALFGELREAVAAVGPRSEVAASVAAQRLLLAILDALDPVEAAGEGGSVVDLIARDAARSLSVADRAGGVGLTARELGEAVRTATGLTVNDFVIEVRLTRAQTLLAETRLDVGQIAAQVGYEDAAYFSRIFSRRTGVSPSVFRRQQARVQND